ALIGAQFERERWRRIDDSNFILQLVEEISRRAMPAIAVGHWQGRAKARLASARRDRGFRGNRIRRDKTVPARSAADRAQLKSKWRVASGRAAESVMPPQKRRRARPFQATPVASHFSLLPGNATVHHERARTVRPAIPPGPLVGPPRATCCQNPPPPYPHPPASGNKSDKAVADFVFDPARSVVPEKVRALYAYRGAQAILPALFAFQTRLSASRASQRFQPPRHFLRVLAAVEGGNPEVAFPLRAETRAWCDDHIQLAQHPIEHFPAGQALRRLHPDVGRVNSSENLQAGVSRRVAKESGISHVVIDKRAG